MHLHSSPFFLSFIHSDRHTYDSIQTSRYSMCPLYTIALTFRIRVKIWVRRKGNWYPNYVRISSLSIIGVVMLMVIGEPEELISFINYWATIQATVTRIVAITTRFSSDISSHPSSNPTSWETLKQVRFYFYKQQSRLTLFLFHLFHISPPRAWHLASLWHPLLGSLSAQTIPYIWSVLQNRLVRLLLSKERLPWCGTTRQDHRERVWPTTASNKEWWQ